MQTSAPRCPSCDYDLRAHDASGVCPECGAEYELTETLPPLWTDGRRAWLFVHGIAHVPLLIVNMFTIFPPQLWLVVALFSFFSLCIVIGLHRVPKTMWVLESGLLLLSIAMIYFNYRVLASMSA